MAAANCIVVANAAFSVVAATPPIPASLGQVRVARDVANDEMPDNTRTSDKMSQTARHTPGFPPKAQRGSRHHQGFVLARRFFEARRRSSNASFWNLASAMQFPGASRREARQGSNVHTSERHCNAAGDAERRQAAPRSPVCHRATADADYSRDSL